VDALEIHANHDDIVQWFLSPLTNHRSDEYGGSPENRVRFLAEILAAIRREVGKDLTVGARLVIDEMLPGGYHANDLREMMMLLEASGHLDYWSLCMGNNWGSPSYIQPLYYEFQPWAAARSAELKKTTSLPVVFAGRVTSVQMAASMIAAGQADVVGMARATIADADAPRKTFEKRFDEIRPCVGANDCIHRILVDRLPFGCAVNPAAGHESRGDHPPAEKPREIVVVGAGPAGMEVAAIAAERGHRVSLWEREAEIGGQMRIAARAPLHEVYRDFIALQENRLKRLGVDVRLGVEVTPEMVHGSGASAVVVATGAGPRRPDIAGVDLPHVLEMRDVLTGVARPERNVLVIAQEDHIQPLSVADFLAQRGHQVRLLYQSPEPAPLVGRYTKGAILERLCRKGVDFIFMHRPVRIEPGAVTASNVYTGDSLTIDGIDSVVLACGGRSETALYRALKGSVDDLHLLGDAYAPRRITFATRQAFELGRIL
jgi:NADPH-dependent 2,4-dienoyl-CoA reductase/sulfur reductase-like enzyme